MGKEGVEGNARRSCDDLISVDSALIERLTTDGENHTCYFEHVHVFFTKVSPHVPIASDATLFHVMICVNPIVIIFFSFFTFFID